MQVAILPKSQVFNPRMLNPSTQAQLRLGSSRDGLRSVWGVAGWVRVIGASVLVLAIADYMQDARTRNRPAVSKRTGAIQTLSIAQLELLISGRRTELKMLEEQLADLKRRSIILTLAFPSGSSFALDVMPTDSISRVKQMAKESLKLGDFKGLQLVYGTEHMEDDKTIADYDVTAADLITLIVVPATSALSRLQGNRRDKYGCTFTVQNDMCGVLLSSGQYTIEPLSQDSSGQVGWLGRWHVDIKDLAKSEEMGVLHRVPATVQDTHLAWYR